MQRGKSRTTRSKRDFALHGWASIFGLEGGRRRKWAIKSRGRRKGKGGGSQRYGMHGKRGRTKRAAENRKETERKTLCILYKRMVFIGSVISVYRQLQYELLLNNRHNKKITEKLCMYITDNYGCCYAKNRALIAAAKQQIRSFNV